MKAYYETPSGAIDGSDLVRGMRLTTCQGLRPGKYVSDATLVALGKAIVAGKPLCATAVELGISRRTAGRWKKRLGL